jgi:enamine deaminase RidA (YjgF/YER057c/UK114 family)
MKISSAMFIALVCALPAAFPAEPLSPEQKLAAMGLTLKAVPPVVANYVPAVRSGNLVFLAGQVPRGADGKVLAGKVGREVTTEQAAAAARIGALQLLSALKAEIGELSKVKRIVRVGGFVNCTEDFTEQPTVINGCSDVLVAVFGDRGRHARAAVGVAALPLGASVEVDMIVEIMDR